MERPRGLEPPPTAWQAVVLPLYYGRETPIPVVETFIAREPPWNKGRSPQVFGTPVGLGHKASHQALIRLIDFDNSSGLHDWRLFLPLGKAGRALPVDVNPRELFSVMVVDRNLPVTVPAPPVTPES
jgi:hypothetical protein